MDSLIALGWRYDMLGNFSASQAGFQNWTEGGVNTFAFTTALEGEGTHLARRWEQTHSFSLSFGLVKQDTLDFRKAEDEILLQSSFQYQGDGFFATFNPTFANELRTQFAEGFNFEKDPLGLGRTPPVLVSAFFSPAVLVQSFGLTYDPNSWFTQRFGVGAKETLVLIERLRPLYGVDLDQTVRLEVGLESLTEVDREIFENVRYKSSLGLFAAFNNPDVPDVLWKNAIAMKVNTWLGVNFQFVALFDKDRSDAVQLKEVLSLGISFALL